MKLLVSASILQLSGSSKKPKEVAMTSPPVNEEKGASSKPQPSASASKESQQDKTDASQQHDDKDGKNKAKVSPAAEPEEATKSTIVQDEKVPEPGFDAPEDKMQGIEQKFPLPEKTRSSAIQCSFAMQAKSEVGDDFSLLSALFLHAPIVSSPARNAEDHPP